MLRLRDRGCQGRVPSCNIVPMPKRSLWLRAPLFLLTLLQFSVPAAAAWADARLGEATGPAHIESHSTSSCARVHPADCAFHRFLSAPLARQSAAVWRVRDGLGIRWTALLASAPRAVARSAHYDSRAPPTLS